MVVVLVGRDLSFKATRARHVALQRLNHGTHVLAIERLFLSLRLACATRANLTHQSAVTLSAVGITWFWSVAPMASSVELPPDIAQHLTGWGPTFRRKVGAALGCWRDRNPGKCKACPADPLHWHLGTDFSGIQAVVWAAKETGLNFRHVFACELAKAPREVSQLNNPVDGKLFHDILLRDHAELPTISLYTAGFPCTPFSSLRTRAPCFRDKNARQFRATVETLRRCRPAAAVLENVVGIRRVMRQVLSRLNSIGGYSIITMGMNPALLGEPQSRPRVYFLCVREDVALGNKPVLEAVAKEMLAALHETSPRPCSSQLLPNHHPLVVAAARSHPKPRAPGGTKWRSQALDARTVAKLSRGRPPLVAGVTAVPSASDMGLSAPRECCTWNTIRQHMQPGMPLCVDVSQTLGRMVRTDGCVPTVTCGGKLVVSCGHVQRCVLPIEKLLLQGFPVHKMLIPQGITGHQLGRMAGNAMHVKCAAAALLIATSLVTSTKQSFPLGPRIGGVTAKRKPRKMRIGSAVRQTPQRAQGLTGGVSLEPNPVARAHKARTTTQRREDACCCGLTRSGLEALFDQ